MRRALAVLLLWSSPTLAQPEAGAGPPLYDVEARCERHFKGAVGICIDAEQRDYDLTRLLWPSLGPQQQAKCARYVASPEPRRYAALWGCVAVEAELNDIARRQATTRFRP